MVRIAAGGASLAAEAAGEGECVVLLHAGVADRRMWQSTSAALSPKFRVIVYDRRGFGETSSPDEPFRHIDDLNAVVQYFGCPSAHLIGCSQGGRIAIDYALAWPERVRSLVLVASAITGTSAPSEYPAEIAQLMDELDKAEGENDIERVNRLEAHLWLDGPLSPANRVTGAIRDLFLAMNGQALRHMPLTQEQPCASAAGQLQRLTQPALVIWGKLDFPHIQERSRQMASRIAQAQPHVMKSCAHLPNLEQPTIFDEAVKAFLLGLVPPTL